MDHYNNLPRLEKTSFKSFIASRLYFGIKCILGQQRLRRACANAQIRKSNRHLHTLNMNVDGDTYSKKLDASAWTLKGGFWRICNKYQNISTGLDKQKKISVKL